MITVLKNTKENWRNSISIYVTFRTSTRHREKNWRRSEWKRARLNVERSNGRHLCARAIRNKAIARGEERKLVCETREKSVVDERSKANSARTIRAGIILDSGLKRELVVGRSRTDWLNVPRRRERCETGPPLSFDDDDDNTRCEKAREICL